MLLVFSCCNEPPEGFWLRKLTLAVFACVPGKLSKDAPSLWWLWKHTTSLAISSKMDSPIPRLRGFIIKDNNGRTNFQLVLKCNRLNFAMIELKAPLTCSKLVNATLCVVLRCWSSFSSDLSSKLRLWNSAGRLFFKSSSLDWVSCNSERAFATAASRLTRASSNLLMSEFFIVKILWGPESSIHYSKVTYSCGFEKRRRTSKYKHWWMMRLQTKPIYFDLGRS